MNPSASSTFGKYDILEELGKGGFATVYRTRDRDLDREVALKVLDPLLMRDPVWVRRFRQEAKAIARLQHPHIITIYEVGESEGRLFIAMQLASDGDLAQRIHQRGALPWHEVRQTASQVAQALDFAHAQEIIHRDLKPSNILFDRYAGALLTDFGFARIVADNSLSMSLSAASGGIMGTPGYIAPEIWDGQPATPQSDVYSLGCIVYEMVTGQPLFAGETPLQTMRLHDQGPQFPQQWPAGAPSGLTKVLQRALAHDPQERYASAGEFAQALAALPAASGAPTGAGAANVIPPASPDPASGRKWPLWAGVVILLAILLAGGWWVMRGRSGEEIAVTPTSVAQSPVPATTQLPTSSSTATSQPAPTATKEHWKTEFIDGTSASISNLDIALDANGCHFTFIRKEDFL